MDIITDNYIWFLISGFVLLLITIGYYADQTNFGRRKLGQDEPKDTSDSPATVVSNVSDNPVVVEGTANFDPTKVATLPSQSVEQSIDSLMSLPDVNKDNQTTDLNSNLDILPNFDMNSNAEDIWKF